MIREITYHTDNNTSESKEYGSVDWKSNKRERSDNAAYDNHTQPE